PTVKPRTGESPVLERTASPVPFPYVISGRGHLERFGGRAPSGRGRGRAGGRRGVRRVRRRGSRARGKQRRGCRAAGAARPPDRRAGGLRARRPPDGEGAGPS